MCLPLCLPLCIGQAFVTEPSFGWGKDTSVLSLSGKWLDFNRVPELTGSDRWLVMTG